MKFYLATSIFLLSCFTQAKTFEVTVFEDEYDGICNTHCSLRDAITESNKLAGIDNILLQDGTYSIQIKNSDEHNESYPENQNLQGDFDVLDSVIIKGKGIERTFIDGNGKNSLFDTRQGSSTIRDLTITNGYSFNGGAGGVTNAADLTLYQVSVSKNETESDCAAQGGGVYNVNIVRLVMSTVLITGGHSGIGFECCKVLISQYKKNIVLAGRSPESMEVAATALRQLGGTNVNTLTLDTSSLPSVRAAAVKCREMISRHEMEPLSALLCNAGGRFFGTPIYNLDGYELTFAANYLGHFLLVQLLIDSMETHGRIVFTSSGTHDPETPDGQMVGPPVEPDANNLSRTGKNGKKPISSGAMYATAKLCVILYAYELHARLQEAGSELTSIAFDPGSIPNTGYPISS